MTEEPKGEPSKQPEPEKKKFSRDLIEGQQDPQQLSRQRAKDLGQQERGENNSKRKEKP